jgi:hypothetical protein
MNTKAFPFLNVLALIAMFYVTYLSLALPLGGRTTKELSDLYASFFTPSGFTFMIWNLIYLGLIANVVGQFFSKSHTGHERADYTRKIGWLFIASCILNASWLFAWHYNLIWLSLIIMISLLIVLIRIYQKLEIGSHQVSSSVKWLVQIPFQIYLGWISVATVANFSAFLISSGLVLTNGLQQIISLCMMAVVFFIAFKMRRERGDFVYPLVISWALIGIGMKYLNDAREDIWIGLAALIIAAIIFIMNVIVRKRNLSNVGNPVSDK